MDERFRDVVESLVPSFEALIGSDPVRPDHRWPAGGGSGVYLFTDGEAHLYVGRSNNIARRYGHHTGVAAGDNQAVFAFRLAREATGYTKPTYKPGEGSRKWLASHPPFVEQFNLAKRRLRAMEFRYVLEPNPIRQCILEVYCAVALGTPYNDFDNH